MAGPMGYDKYVQGLRSPNEVDPRYYKVGPLSPLKCCGHGAYGQSCWYCIVNQYYIIPPPIAGPGHPPEGDIVEQSAACDWYRDGDTNSGGRITPGNQAYLEECPMYTNSNL